MASSSASISPLHLSAAPPRRRAVRYRRFVRCSAVTSANDSSATSATDSSARRFRADCVIVGAGISGLCTAQALTVGRSGAPDVLVTEARDKVGGNITTVERDGYLWEEGPNSFQPSDAVLTMAVTMMLPVSFPFCFLCFTVAVYGDWFYS